MRDATSAPRTALLVHEGRWKEASVYRETVWQRLQYLSFYPLAFRQKETEMTDAHCFSVVQTIVDNSAVLLCFFYFYSHPSITGKSEPVNTMSKGLICILFTEHKFNLFLRGWIGSWRSEKLGIEIPLFPRNFRQNLILFPWKNTCGTLNL